MVEVLVYIIVPVIIPFYKHSMCLSVLNMLAKPLCSVLGNTHIDNNTYATNRDPYPVAFPVPAVFRVHTLATFGTVK